MYVSSYILKILIIVLAYVLSSYCSRSIGEERNFYRNDKNVEFAHSREGINTLILFDEQFKD